jgi:hypothetical protein
VVASVLAALRELLSSPAHPSGGIPLTAAPDGLFASVKERLLSTPRLFLAVAPLGQVSWDDLNTARGVLGLTVLGAAEYVAKFRKDRSNVRDACLAVFGEYFGIKGTPRMSDLAKRSPIAATLSEAITQHTQGKILSQEIVLCVYGRSSLENLWQDNLSNDLLRATVFMITSKIQAACGNLEKAYNDLLGVWNCASCMSALEGALGQRARDLMLRQLLNHAYLLCSDDPFDDTEDAARYRELLREASALLGVTENHPDISAEKWKPRGEVGLGLGLHFGNASFLSALRGGAPGEAQQAVARPPFLYQVL